MATIGQIVEAIDVDESILHKFIREKGSSLLTSLICPILVKGANGLLQKGLYVMLARQS